jgi:hypothetical protein
LTTSEFTLSGYDIVDDMLVEESTKMPVKKIFASYSSEYYDKRPILDENKKGILCELKGTEKAEGRNKNRASGGDILGYMVAHSSGFDNPDLDSSLLVAARYDGNGFFVRKDNYLEKLPMFAASRYITYNRSWTERARIMKSADGADRFSRDVANGKLKQFLLRCLLFTCLEMQNHMRTFTGSDGRLYRNELCLDGTNGETLALHDIKNLKLKKGEKELTAQWENVLKYAKKTRKNERTDGYNKKLTYGVYQIYAELDTSHKDEVTDKTVWDNVELHSALTALKGLVSAYYNAEIVPALFEYEFLK